MNAVDVLRYGHLTVLGTVDGLAGPDWETPGVCGVWSTRQIVAHLASYEVLLAEVASTLLDPGGGPTPCLDAFLAKVERFNDDEVARRTGQSAEETLAEYAAAEARVRELVAGVPEERRCDPGTLPWYGTEYALDDLLVYQYYGHKREHSAQIAVFRDRLAR